MSQPHHGSPTHVEPTMLRAAAEDAMRELGFEPEFPAQAQKDVAAMTDALPAAPGAVDMRSLLWSSIDNDDSKDLDQIEIAVQGANGAIRVSVGIADVDSRVPKGSALDLHAFTNTCSVYTGVETFPMLPLQLSTGLTSLNPDADRLAIVVSFDVAQDGTISNTEVTRAIVRNKAQLAYEHVGPWLDAGAAPPAEVTRIPELAAQLRLQHEAAERLRSLRAAHGALELDTIETKPIMQDGRVVNLEAIQASAARSLIEDFMIAANNAIAVYLETRNIVSIRRIVKIPDRWSQIRDLARDHGGTLPEEPSHQALAKFLQEQKAKDPLRFPDLSLAVVKLLGPGEYSIEMPGDLVPDHFGLAVDDYAHSTAPNRRYADLVTQRLLKAAMTNTAQPYSTPELTKIAEQCTLKEQAANKVERKVKKVAAAVLLAHRVGETFDGIVTGVTEHGSYVRIFKPPTEGRVMRGDEGLKVGQKVRVKLLHTDSQKGFIDFARA